MNRVTLCACFPAALGAFDFGFLALAGPGLAPELGATGAAYPWLFSASAFAYGAAVMPAAALTGRLGAARSLAAGLAATAAGAALLAVAPDLLVAVCARVLFGLGGALAATASLLLLAAIADDRDRRAGFAMLGGAVAAGFSAGALLAALPEWRLVLAGLAPSSCAVAVVAARLEGATADGRAPALRGARLLSAAIVAAAIGIAGVGEAWTLLAALGLAVAALRRAGAWLPRARVTLAAVCAGGAATTASGVGATILIGSALADQKVSSALLGAFALGVLPGAALARGVTQRAGPRAAAEAGLALQAIALAAIALTLATASAAVLAVALAAFGVGHVAANGGAAAAVTELATGTVAPVAALLVAAQYVGGGLGSLLSDSVASAHGVPAGLALTSLIAVAGVVALTPTLPRADGGP